MGNPRLQCSSYRKRRRTTEGSISLRFQRLLLSSSFTAMVCISAFPCPPTGTLISRASSTQRQYDRARTRLFKFTINPYWEENFWEENDPSSESNQQQQQDRPIPAMPSQLFRQLALSQLELLASSLPSPERPGSSKIKSMALYFPRENANTGQLEFIPVVLYPDPSSERVFIASEADSGVAPTLPLTLTKLPGFAHAASLLPAYPMISSGTEAWVGIVEEVLCDFQPSNKCAALSVPLFSGTQTVGVLLVSPSVASPQCEEERVWTEEEKRQVAITAKSLSLALSMDTERTAVQAQNDNVREALSDSLHQFKNPLQALRTYGKLLQCRIADDATNSGGQTKTQELMELTEHLVVQSDRLVDRLRPVDSIVDSLGTTEPNQRLLSLMPAASNEQKPEQQQALSSSKLELPRNIPDSGMPPLGASIESGPEDSVIHFQQTDMHLDEQMKRSKNGYPVNSPSALITNVELEMAFVNDVLDVIISAFRAIAIDRGISFIVQESDELPGVNVCPQALQEAVSNVLDNAFKYVVVAKSNAARSNPSPQVRVRLMPNKKLLPPGVTILVEDNGPGIRREDREKIFERGTRIPSTAQSVEGTGIGLDIARSLIRDMGGSIRVVDNDIYPGSLDGTIVEFVLYRKAQNV